LNGAVTNQLGLRFQPRSPKTFSNHILLISGFLAFQQFLQNNLSLSSRNFALVNGEHIGSRTENEN
jgi:hypothetical protein